MHAVPEAHACTLVPYQTITLSKDELDKKQSPHASHLNPGGCIYDGGKSFRKTQQHVPHVVRPIDRPESLNLPHSHQITSAARFPRARYPMCYPAGGKCAPSLVKSGYSQKFGPAKMLCPFRQPRPDRFRYLAESLRPRIGHFADLTSFRIPVS